MRKTKSTPGFSKGKLIGFVASMMILCYVALLSIVSKAPLHQVSLMPFSYVYVFYSKTVGYFLPSSCMSSLCFAVNTFVVSASMALVVGFLFYLIGREVEKAESF